MSPQHLLSTHGVSVPLPSSQQPSLWFSFLLLPLLSNVPPPPLQSPCLSSPAPAASDTRLLFLDQSLAKSPSRPWSHRKSLLAFQVPGSSSGFQCPPSSAVRTPNLGPQRLGTLSGPPSSSLPFSLGLPKHWLCPARAYRLLGTQKLKPHVTHLLPQPSSSSGLSGPCETLLLPCTFSRPCVLACSLLLD